MSDVAIQVQGLGKRYTIGGERKPYRTLRESLTGAFRRRPAIAERSFWALRDVSFTINRGEVVGIIGRNGAGKSTLLKVLSRITEPTEGGADIDGRVGSLLEVGTGFHPELTGRENVYLNGAILGMRRAEISRKFDEIVAFAETEQFLDTPVKFYSSGMYTRLAFAVAAHLDPEIRIVDEVLAVGDAAFQRKCLGKMRDVSASGRTVLFVSHTMSAVQQLCGRVMLLRGGTVAADGPPADVIDRYLSDAAVTVDGSFDLTDHPARAAGHAPVIRRAVLSGANGSPTGQFYPDDPLQVELTLAGPEPIREARLAIAIEDSSNRRITTLASYFGPGGGLGDLPADCTVRCRLGRLGLGAGRYLLSVSVADKYRGLIDSVDGAGWIDVGWRNNFGNGEPYHPVYGPVLRDSAWELVPRPASAAPAVAGVGLGAVA
jgi:lipopolysaccharide transport system ATP-binding protein